MNELIDDILIMREYYQFRKWVEKDYGRYDYYRSYELKFKLLPEILQKILTSEMTLMPKHLTTCLLRRIFTSLCKNRQPNFIMDEACSTTFDKVIMYLRENPKFSSLGPNYSLEKGLLICGKVGCGKTLFFQGLRDLIKEIHLRKGYEGVSEKMFDIESANTIVQLFAVKGHAIMLSHPWLEDNTYKDFGLLYNNLLIDDLGTESLGSHFGNQINVLGELLQIRYNNRNKYVTHATSNLDTKALKSTYGERVYSRINEMFNYIHMNGDDRRL